MLRCSKGCSIANVTRHILGSSTCTHLVEASRRDARSTSDGPELYCAVDQMSIRVDLPLWHWFRRIPTRASHTLVPCLSIWRIHLHDLLPLDTCKPFQRQLLGGGGLLICLDKRSRGVGAEEPEQQKKITIHISGGLGSIVI